MTTQNSHGESIAEQLFVERALAYYRDMKAVSDNAPDGHVIRLAEIFAVTQGRELVRMSLESVLQEQITEHEKKTKRDSAQDAKPKQGIAETETKKS
jgi:hypothetical protein